MARALLNFGCMAVSRTANLRDDNKSPIFFASALLSFVFFTYRSPHHGSKICQKIPVGRRSDPQVAQLFCSARTIMARALLNCGFCTYRSPHHGSTICQKNSR